ncbi:MAG: hypothetical protein KBS94_05015 [Prevotella sp.]|nr:hypothetical protein [Candidatus Equicola faecalis]
MLTLFERAKTFVQKHISYCVHLRKDKVEEKRVSEETRSSLAPRILAKEDSSFHSVEELRYALSLPECRNIALTGVFGSGKSSVINTCLSLKGVSKKVLRISLSNLLESQSVANNTVALLAADIAESEETNGTKDGQKTDNVSQTETSNKDEEKAKSHTVYENEIEYKIFQQIIQKADYRKTAQSRHRHINVLDKCTITRIAFDIILFFVCFVVLFEPKILQVKSFYDAYFDILKDKSGIVNTIADISSAIIMAFIVFRILYIFIPKLYSFRVKSIKAKDCEINFEDKEPLFSKWLDDILYFFKAGEYEIVVFEDLDRISHPQELFLKLREMNILLNESEYFKKKDRIIRFVYAIKDDVFQNEVRTKFFDYIIPVIPVIDCFNSGEYMIDHHKDLFKGISNSDLKQMGLYVSRMRDLINIINEYQLYEKTIHFSNMSKRKLLAITIYKNLFPGDYSYLHDKEGCLYAVLNNKKVFSQRLTQDLEANLAKVNVTVDENRESIIKLRKSVLDSLNNKHSIVKLNIGGKQYSLEEVSKSKQLFDSFKNNRIDQCFVQESDEVNPTSYNMLFKDIIVEIDPDGNFDEEMYNRETELEVNTIEKRSLESQINAICNNSFSHLMRKIGNGDVTIPMVYDICKNASKHPEDENKLCQLAETIHSMIRNEYIAEDYASYISFTYHGTFNEDESNFLHSVIQGQHLDYNYPLKNISSFISGITTDNFSDRSILNYDLANYIFSRNDMDTQCSMFANTARSFLDFVVGYDLYKNRNNKFFTELFNGWNGCVSVIMACEDDSLQASILSIYFREAPQSISISLEEKQFLNSKYAFIANHISNFEGSKIKGFIEFSGLCFDKLIAPETETKDLFDYVINNKHFTINLDNLLVIYGEKFKTESISCILSGNERVKVYLLRRIKELYSQLPPTSKQETEQALIYVVKNEELTDEQVGLYLSEQKNKISLLKDVPASRYELVFKGGFVKPSWENVRQYFSIFDELSNVAPFINSNADKLSQYKFIDGDENLQVLLFGDNTTLDNYAFEKLIGCCTFIFDPEEIDGISEERLEIFLDNDLLDYSPDYNAFMSKYSPHLLAKYIIKYFDEMDTAEGEVNFTNSNRLGIEILSSDLPDEKKNIFLRDYACLIEAEGHNDGLNEYARMICEFYHQNDCSDADYNLITKALNIYNGEGTWFIRIELINKVHRSTTFNEERTVNMVETLLEPYTELNTYHTQTILDNNPQNNELVDYLRSHLKYISNKIDKGDNIKVTYHRNPNV